MKNLYKEVSNAIFNSLKDGEEAVTSLDGEDTLYLRYNNGKVRQNTQVHQYLITLLYKKQNKTLRITWPLETTKEKALAEAVNQLHWLRKECAGLPDSEHLPKIENLGRSDKEFKGDLPSSEKIIQDIAACTSNHDFCGFIACGPQVYANENSKGQSHWFSRESFFVDYSLYHGERAVKGGYSDSKWSSNTLKNQIHETATQLSLMTKPVVNVKPGKYKVFLAPAAVSEMVEWLGWHSFSQKGFQTGTGFFMDLGRGTKKLNPQLTIRENFDLGLIAPFNELGEVGPSQVSLIENGQWKQWLTSTRSAMEFNVPNNFATSNEHPRSLEILPGTLKQSDVLKELGTGLYLSNLHYVNASDQKSARLTGMTRYACFWVEGGEIVGPIENLRFDESLYDAWGAKLIGLTDTNHINPNVWTYSQRQFGGNKLPGMLVDDFSFTL